ncbi:MAG TPA: hypothetical protein VGN17_19430 [Bryobacteraceae bacterium]|jgi:hypothetical protein
MLLTDGVPNDDEALKVYEAAILDVANTERIELAAKLDLALEEISEEVLDVLLDHTRASDPQSTVRRTLGVSDVVVSAPMRRWHAVHTLETVYRDAFNNQLNDRYHAKFQEYHRLSKDAREHTFRFGIGLALTPIPKAVPPTFTFVAGLLLETIYYVQVSWVSPSGQEGAPSDVTTFDSPVGSLPVVTAVNPPALATGFNVYVGLSPDSMALQTATPVPVGQSFTLATTGVAAGRAPGMGQSADYYVVGGPMMRRG